MGAEFLLIHGSCHGAWCWNLVATELRALGHSARAIDLPAHGDDPAPAASATLAGYARAIVDAVDPNRPVILVGHSMAGYPITAAYDLAPERFAKLVYLCAYVPVPGMSIADMRRAGPRQPLRGTISVSRDASSFSFDPALVRDRFYHDCSPQVAQNAITRLCPEPIGPQETPLAPSANWTLAPRHYIRCTEDRAIPPEYQEIMTTGFPPEGITALRSSHSPFLSMPDALARLLDEIARG